MSGSKVAVLLLRASTASGAVPEPLTTWLSPSETARLSSIHSTQRKSEFLVGRFALRRLLTVFCPLTKWHDWVLDWQENGPPCIARCAVLSGVAVGELNLSLSHSGGLMAFAVSDGAVGIDLEVQIRDREVKGLIEMVCTPQEQQRLATVGHHAQRMAFDAVWTLKEAWFKRERTGIDLSRIKQLQTHQLMHVDDGDASHPVTENKNSPHPNAKIWQGRCNGLVYTIALCVTKIAEVNISFMLEDVPASTLMSTWAVAEA